MFLNLLTKKELEEIQKNIKNVEKVTKNSFNLFKKDIKEINSTLDKLKLDHDILLELKGRLDAIGTQTKVFKQPSKNLNAFKQHLNRGLELDLDTFTQREKTLIRVLLDNKDMALSYKDIGKITNKSPSTIRCQINSLKHKTNVLIEEIDIEGSKRYKVKEEIKIKKSI